MKPLIALLLVIAFSAAVAADNGDFGETKQLIESKVSCSELTDAQLESIGDYFMEQMHPGELHEIMDERMGGEGSESLRLAHVNMAKYFYCGDTSAMHGGMMGMMMGFNGGMTNMMGNYGYGMMGSSGFFGTSLLWLLFVAIGAFVFSVIFWWAYNLMAKAKGKKR